MDLVNYRNVNIDVLDNLNISAIICATGYESRCTAIATRFSHLKCEKFVLSFNSFQRNAQRRKNDDTFKNLNYSFVTSDEHDASPVIDIIKNILDNCIEESCNIVFDYSSMTRIWYAGVLQFLRYSSDYMKVARIFFCYSFSTYSPSKDTGIYNKEVGPIRGFFSLNIPDKPTALLVGLGYEKGRAYGLQEYLDAETYVFYTEAEKHNQQFSSDVESINREIFLKLRKDHIIKYPISNIEYLINLVYSKCSDLIDDYRIILAPCGPKPFTLACLITAIKLNNIDVWRISTGIEKVYKREANGHTSILECSFKRNSTLIG